MLQNLISAITSLLLFLVCHRAKTNFTRVRESSQKINGFPLTQLEVIRSLLLDIHDQGQVGAL